MGGQRPQTALITGPSSGIGLELAKLFAQDGYSLVLVSSNKDKLESAAEIIRAQRSVRIKIIVKDLSQPSAAPEIYEDLKKQNIAVDILVNNAGFGALGLYHTSDWSHALAMMQVNMIALAQFTRLFLPEMVARKQGKILNVGSTAGFEPGPLMAVYYATKAFVLSFSEAIAYELQGTGVTMTTLCPGPTITDFGKRAKMEKTFSMSGFVKMTAQSVALAGYKGMLCGQTLVIPGLLNKLLVFCVRLLPRKVVALVVKSVQKEMAS